jgi:hypothetical protein
MRHAFRLRELLSQQFLEELERTLPAGELDRLVDRIAAREVDPYSSVRQLLDAYVGRVPRSGPAGAR